MLGPTKNKKFSIECTQPAYVGRAGLLQHTFDITIQAPGIATFTTPALTFPNAFHAPPGTKLNFLSFDRQTRERTSPNQILTSSNIQV